MKILPSHKITGQLLDVILEAKKELVLVSPYVNFTYDKQVIAALTAARNRGIKIDFFIRDEASNQVSQEQVAGLGITPRLVPNLHAKFYYNESTGIITSLNLLSSSIGNSIEIGCQLETSEELADLRHFVEQFLTPHETGRVAASQSQPQMRPQRNAVSLHPTPSPSKGAQRLHFEPFGVVLADCLGAQVSGRISVNERPDGCLSIRAAGNNFDLFIEHPDQLLIISAIVSSSEADRFANKGKTHFASASYDYEIERGEKGYYDALIGIRKQKTNANRVEQLPHAEKLQLLDEVAQFILSVTAYKADWKTS